MIGKDRRARALGGHDDPEDLLTTAARGRAQSQGHRTRSRRASPRRGRDFCFGVHPLPKLAHQDHGVLERAHQLRRRQQQVPGLQLGGRWHVELLRVSAQTDPARLSARRGEPRHLARLQAAPVHPLLRALTRARRNQRVDGRRVSVVRGPGVRVAAEGEASEWDASEWDASGMQPDAGCGRALQGAATGRSLSRTPLRSISGRCSPPPRMPPPWPVLYQGTLRTRYWRNTGSSEAPDWSKRVSENMFFGFLLHYLLRYSFFYYAFYYCCSLPS